MNESLGLEILTSLIGAGRRAADGAMLSLGPLHFA